MLNNEQSKEALKPMTREEFRALITLGHADMRACKDEQRIRTTIENVQELNRSSKDVIGNI